MFTLNSLNNLKGTSTSTAGVVDDILLVVEELLQIQNVSVCSIPYDQFHVKISRQYYPIVLLVTIMLIVIISTVIWESYVELEEDGLD